MTTTTGADGPLYVGRGRGGNLAAGSGGCPGRGRRVGEWCGTAVGVDRNGRVDGVR